MKFGVWYRKDPTFFFDEKLTKEQIEKTHVRLMDLEAKSIDDVFSKMQGEVWSPNGEARGLIRSKGLRHTSMSVGDVIEENGRFFQVDFFGFREVA